MDYTQALNAQQAALTTRAINATGILLHTGLGRAVMASEAVDHLKEHLEGNTQLEIDPHTGKRSTRDRAAGDILCELFGAEDFEFSKVLGNGMFGVVFAGTTVQSTDTVDSTASGAFSAAVKLQRVPKEEIVADALDPLAEAGPV